MRSRRGKQPTEVPSRTAAADRPVPVRMPPVPGRTADDGRPSSVLQARLQDAAEAGTRLLARAQGLADARSSRAGRSAAPGAGGVLQRLMSGEDFRAGLPPLGDEHADAIQAIVDAIQAYRDGDPTDAMGLLFSVADAVEELKSALGLDFGDEAEEGAAGAAEADDGFGILRALEAEIVAELTPEPAEEERAQDVIEERLAGNAFRVTSGLDTYAGSFGDGFRAKLDELSSDMKWLDSGAGLAKAMQDYWGAKGDDAARMVAFSYAKPSADGDTSQADLAGLARLEASGRFEYKAEEKYFADMPAGSLGTGYHLITDHNGVLMYTSTLSQDLGGYLNMLAPGGTMYFSLETVDTVIDDDTRGDALKDWLESIEGVTVTASSRSGWKAVRDGPEPVVVPSLRLKTYELVPHSNAPHREFERA